MKFNKKDLVKEISKKTGVPQNEVKIVVESFLTTVKEVLKNKGKIEIRGFGIFYTKKRKGKKIRLPGQSKIIESEDKIIPYFKGGTKFVIPNK